MNYQRIGGRTLALLALSLGLACQIACADEPKANSVPTTLEILTPRQPQPKETPGQKSGYVFTMPGGGQPQGDSHYDWTPESNASKPHTPDKQPLPVGAVGAGADLLKQHDIPPGQGASPDNGNQGTAAGSSDGDDDDRHRVTAKPLHKPTAANFPAGSLSIGADIPLDDSPSASPTHIQPPAVSTFSNSAVLRNVPAVQNQLMLPSRMGQLSLPNNAGMLNQTAGRTFIPANLIPAVGALKGAAAGITVRSTAAPVSEVRPALSPAAIPLMKR